jgi:hypothetical protein
MRTTVDIDRDVLDAARQLATARGVSLGAALSELARRGMESHTLSSRNGFPVFQVPRRTPSFGTEEMSAAEGGEDEALAGHFREAEN